jgi:hypothetical protein
MFLVSMSPSPQSPLKSISKENVNQLVSKAKDSLEKKKKKRVQQVLTRRKRNQAPREGASRGNLCVVICDANLVIMWSRNPQSRLRSDLEKSKEV